MSPTESSASKDSSKPPPANPEIRGVKYLGKMSALETGKRDRSDSPPESPEIAQRPEKRPDLSDSNSKRKKAEATTQKAFIKPLYPSQEDRKGTEDASERGTRLKIMGVDLPEDPKVTPYEKVSHEDLWDHLIAKKALIASALEKISSQLLIQTLEEKKQLSGIEHISNVVSEKVIKVTTEILCTHLEKSDPTADIVAVAKAAGHSVAAGIADAPFPDKLSYQEEDNGDDLSFKLRTLKFTSPTLNWAEKMAITCARSGLQMPLTEYQKEGLLTEVHKAHAGMVNSINEGKAHIGVTQDQVTLLTSAVTELLHKPCEKQLRIYGLEEHLETKLINNKDQRARSQRNKEALVYLRDVLGRCGYKNNFIIDLIEPAHNNKNNKRPPLVGIITLPYESDKYRVESLLKEARSEGKTTVTSRRQVAENHKASNLPSIAELDTQLKVLYKRKLSQDLSTLLKVEGNEGKVKDIQTRYELEPSYRFAIRKKTSNKDPKVFYEFLCPASNSVYMTYKYENTFNQYDFCHEIVNPRLRLMASQNGGESMKKYLQKN